MTCHEDFCNEPENFTKRYTLSGGGQHYECNAGHKWHLFSGTPSTACDCDERKQNKPKTVIEKLNPKERLKID